MTWTTGLVFHNLGSPKTQEAKSGDIKTAHTRLGNWGFAHSHLMASISSDYEIMSRHLKLRNISLSNPYVDHYVGVGLMWSPSLDSSLGQAFVLYRTISTVNHNQWRCRSILFETSIKEVIWRDLPLRFSHLIFLEMTLLSFTKLFFVL